MTELTFEKEVIAFHVAIMLTLFPVSKFHGVFMSAAQVSDVLNDVAGVLSVGMKEEATAVNLNLYIDPIALHQGFRIFKKQIIQHGIEVDPKHDLPMESFFTEGGRASSHFVKFNTLDMDKARKKCQPQLKGHLDSLIATIALKRDDLLIRKNFPVSSLRKQDEVFVLSPGGVMIDRCKHTTLVSPVTSTVPCVRSKLQPWHHSFC